MHITPGNEGDSQLEDVAFPGACEERVDNRVDSPSPRRASASASTVGADVGMLAQRAAGHAQAGDLTVARAMLRSVPEVGERCADEVRTDVMQRSSVLVAS